MEIKQFLGRALFLPEKIQNFGFKLKVGGIQNDISFYPLNIVDIFN